VGSLGGTAGVDGDAGERGDAHRDQAVNRLELVARWADDLAHEIKNPFHSMVINLELVKRRAGDPDGLVGRAEVVESELHRVHALIDSVLKLVRPWPDSRTADPDSVMDALAPAIQARARLRRLEYAHERGGAPLAMPPGDLAQVVLNLVDNAMDALGEGGRLLIRTGADGSDVRIEVVDDGPGMAVEGDPFEPGTTTRPGRPGLGLAVCRRLVARAGGSVQAGSAAGGGGTAIAVRIPRPGNA
jgi:signal transduction histidine kinase